MVVFWAVQGVNSSSLRDGGCGPLLVDPAVSAVSHSSVPSTTPTERNTLIFHCVSTDLSPWIGGGGHRNYHSDR